MTIKTTEREVASWISGVINNILKIGDYPFEESTVETLLKNTLYACTYICMYQIINNMNAYVNLFLCRKTCCCSKATH